MHKGVTLTKVQTLLVKMSEARQKLNDLLGVETRSETQQADLETLTGSLQALEPELRAAIVAEDTTPTIETRAGEDSESVELRALLRDASAGRILAAVHARTATDGREAELQQHFGVGGNELPHALLEHRARTEAPSNTATEQAEIIQPIFGQTGAAFLAIPQPSVAPGSAVYPIISSRPTPETPAEGATVTADIPAGSFSADLLKPQAAQAQIEFSREDAAAFPSMSDALGRVIVDATGFALDSQMLAHTTEGLLTAGLTAPGNPAAEATFANYRSALNTQVNGREAGQASDCRILLGAKTYSHADTKFRTADSELSALDWLMAKSGGVRVHVAVPAIAAKRQDAVIAKALGQQHAVMPVWSSVQLVTDEITKLQKRLIVLTAIQLFSFKVLRADGFARVRFQVAA